MPREAPILVQNEHDRPDHWRRFAAILCFMGFYTQFVVNAHQFYRLGLDEEYRFGLPLKYFWVYLTATIAALLLYPAGRALWFGHRTACYWLMAAIVALCVATGIECAVEVSSGYAYYWGTLNNFTWSMPVHPLLGALRIISENLNWLILLIVASWFAWRDPKRSQRTQTIWAIVAFSWCIAHIAKSLFSDEIAMLVGYYTQDQGGGSVGVIAYVLVLVTLAILLWRGSDWARTVALGIAAAAIVTAWENWYIIPMLVNVAIRSFYIATTHMPLDEINRWVWTENDALGLLVHPVRLIGPWLLIAIYAWRVPMRMPPDDGTPFPRRFCGNCHYNLHGIDSERCPECGCVLVAKEQKQ